MLRIPESEMVGVYSIVHKEFTIKNRGPALFVTQVAFEAVMRPWEFINHLGEAAMGLTFGEIRVRPTFCPTLPDFLTSLIWFLFTLILGALCLVYLDFSFSRSKGQQVCFSFCCVEGAA